MALLLDEAGNDLFDEIGGPLEDEGATSWPAVYTYNFCPNPSFEAGITGASPVLGASLSWASGLAYSGSRSLGVTTPGNASGEGVTLPPGAIQDYSDGAIQFQLQAGSPSASGTLTVSAVDQTTSTVLGTTAVSFDSTTSWQLVTMNGLSLTGGDILSVIVETSSPQATSFNIDCVQYEPETSVNFGVIPTPYIDGDLPFGFWVGTAESSNSYRLYQNQLSASGNINVSQLAAAFLQSGLAVPLVFTNPAAGPTVISGGIDASGISFQGIKTVTPGTWGAAALLVSGFGLYVQADQSVSTMASGVTAYGSWVTGTDPALSYIGPNSILNSGTDTLGSAGYTRPYGTFYAPQAFSVNGTNVWNTARFFAVGFQMGSMAAGVAQNVSRVQAEIAPLTQTGPSAYQRPRSLVTIVSPTVQNMVTNPSFGTSEAGWLAINSASPAIVSSVSVVDPPGGL
jgi:hypothetical protein